MNRRELLRYAVNDLYGWDIDECTVIRATSPYPHIVYGYTADGFCPIEYAPKQYRGTLLHLEGRNKTIVYRVT